MTQVSMLTAPPPPPPPAPARTAHGGSAIALVVIASVLLVLAFGLLAGGGVLMWADRTQRDASGYLTSPAVSLSVPDYAVAATNIDVALSDPSWHVATDALGAVRISATAPAAGPGIFIGIAPSVDVDRYLRGVAYDEPTRFIGGTGGFSYRSHPGSAPQTPPGSQTFWQVQASGAGTQMLTWTVATGHWSVVMMNTDASRGVTSDVAIGATAPFLFGLALGLLIGGGATLIISILLLVLGVNLLRRKPAPPATAAAPMASGWSAAPPPQMGLGVSTYPLRIEGRLDGQPSRWLWLVKWFLLIPHYIVLAFLFVAAAVLTVIAFFAILFTGRYPRVLFDFNLGVLRWWWRVSFYSYGALGTDRYPPFTFEAAADYPATLDVPYPQRLSRGLVLVKWWLLAIPHYIIVGLLVGGSYTGLITILVLVAAIIVLFTGRYPADLFSLVMGLNRWVYRVLAYVLLMRDEYPPFRLDMGGTETGAAPTAPPAAPPVLLQPRPHGV